MNYISILKEVMWNSILYVFLRKPIHIRYKGYLKEANILLAAKSIKKIRGENKLGVAKSY